MKFSSRIESCGLSPMRKFAPLAAEAEKNGTHIYHLNIGQPDIATPEIYYQTLRKFADPVLSYAPSNGLPEMLEAVQRYYAGFGVGLSQDDILIANGGSEALQMLLACILDSGDEIVIPEPFYPNYATMVRLTGAKVHPLTTCPEDGYHYAVREKVEACITRRTRAIMITNPGNPTGAVLTPEELQLMLDIAKKHKLFLICDEVYREFTYNGEPLMSALQYPGYEDNVVVIDSVSKRFSACGARIGMLISRNKELIGHALKWCQARLSSTMADQMAAASLYSVGSEYFVAMRKLYRERRDTMIRKLREIPGIVCEEPKGAFYVMAALPVDDAEKFQHWLLTEFEDQGETLMYAFGAPFYATPGRGLNEVRMAYVLDVPQLERAMDILALAIKQYNERK
ncbi:MAG: pyridoxal phosphate-dependent aminotransferase [Oscillospiraceae bacterium]|nr:pyridoxal phosphate-dependent aminotransferase [Oscillospiraceae bacterium]